MELEEKEKAERKRKGPKSGTPKVRKIFYFFFFLTTIFLFKMLVKRSYYKSSKLLYFYKENYIKKDCLLLKNAGLGCTIFFLI